MIQFDDSTKGSYNTVPNSLKSKHMFGNSIYTGKAESGIRATFFGKVMFFFALAVLMSVVGVYVTSFYFMEYFVATPALMWIAFIAELALVFTARFWSTKAPLNRLLFSLFAFLTGVTVAPLIAIVAASPGGIAIILKALIASIVTFGAVGFIGWTTKRDLSGMRGFLLMAVIGLIVVGIVGIFLPWGSTGEMIYSGIGILIFSAFTAYDFQNLKSYPEDRYIDAAISLYLDIFNLFIFILRFLMANRD